MTHHWISHTHLSKEKKKIQSVTQLTHYILWWRTSTIGLKKYNRARPSKEGRIRWDFCVFRNSESGVCLEQWLGSHNFRNLLTLGVRRSPFIPFCSSDSIEVFVLDIDLKTGALNRLPLLIAPRNNLCYLKPKHIALKRAILYILTKGFS